MSFFCTYACVCTMCHGVCVSKWPAALHKGYLWFELDKIHLMSAFYSVSHKQIPAVSVHFQKNSTTSSDLSPTSVDLHLLLLFILLFIYLFFYQRGSCRALLSCLQCAARLFGCVNILNCKVLHSLVKCHEHRHI